MSESERRGVEAEHGGSSNAEAMAQLGQAQREQEQGERGEHLELRSEYEHVKSASDLLAAADAVLPAGAEGREHAIGANERRALLAEAYGEAGRTVLSWLVSRVESGGLSEADLASAEKVLRAYIHDQDEVAVTSRSRAEGFRE